MLLIRIPLLLLGEAEGHKTRECQKERDGHELLILIYSGVGRYSSKGGAVKEWLRLKPVINA